MTRTSKGNDHFISSPILFIGNEHQKTISIPIKKSNSSDIKYTSKSWNGHEYSNQPKNNDKNFSTSPYVPWSRTHLSNCSKTKYYSHEHSSYFTGNDLCDISQPQMKENFRYKKNNNEINSFIGDFYNGTDFKPYDAVSNCKSAGIIPYTIHDGIVYFLLQQAQYPSRKKDSGWNDFGGKRIKSNESTAETAAREFSEETSCLFYLKENNSAEFDSFYTSLKNNIDLYYSNESVEILKKLIPLSQKYYTDKITAFLHPIYISSKETYISYFVKVDYIPDSDLPKAEDIHIPYETRYIRTCKWFTFEELMLLNEKDFHKRLQITKIQQRISDYFDKGHFC
jgi:8-oxo-dGTP pyrophosphatase MutT (NUDIX family)